MLYLLESEFLLIPQKKWKWKWISSQLTEKHSSPIGKTGFKNFHVPYLLFSILETFCQCALVFIPGSLWAPIQTLSFISSI